MSVVCENMLAARSPFMGHPDIGFQTPPRVISEIKKPTPAWPRENVRPRITGELLCHSPTEGRWEPRRATVRCGQIQVGASTTPGAAPSPGASRLALRRLSLTPGPRPLSFALRRTLDAPAVLTLQASNQQEFDLWVKTIAIELIRQTPLDAIKYLDILTLTPQQRRPEETQKDCNHNCLSDADIADHRDHKSKRCRSLDYNHLDENRNYCQAAIKRASSSESDGTDTIDGVANLPPSPCSDRQPANVPGTAGTNDEQTVEFLLKRCQNADSYVPVKEKLKLFESLCRLERLMSTDETTTNAAKYSTKRTRSLHDLTNSELPSITNCGVKQICKYFETKNDESRVKETNKINIVARGNRTSFGPVKTIINRKYSVQSSKI